MKASDFRKMPAWKRRSILSGCILFIHAALPLFLIWHGIRNLPELYINQWRECADLW